jgi:subtilisin
MARYVMASRRAGKFHESEKVTARKSVDAAISIVHSSVAVVTDRVPMEPTDRRVFTFDADPADVAALRAELDRDVILEPQVLRYPSVRRAPADFLALGNLPASPQEAVGSGSTLRVEVVGASAAAAASPLRGADVILFLRGPGGLQRKLEQPTDSIGACSFSFASVFQAAALVVVPVGDYWPMVVRGITVDAVRVSCPALPRNGPLGWWHAACGQTAFDATLGTGIRVGVIDTGCGPHPNLAHVKDAGAFVDGSSTPGAGADVDAHGSHVCGTIGARPFAPGEYAGIAPGVHLSCARVFATKTAGANQGDIANAIDSLSRDEHVDLINMSLGGGGASEIERDAIRDALERGTLCICAAGNSDGPVEFPAAFPECVAVSALGVEGWAPPGTLSSTRLPTGSERFGDEHLYLANFSCYGEPIAAAGCGVGILSAVPTRLGRPAPYAAMDGTSMASPSTCAALAVLLSADPTYLELPRNETRSAMAREILRKRCRDIGLAARYQGSGLPRI